MVGAGGRHILSPPVKHSDRGRRGVNAQGETERRKRRRMSTEARSKM